MSLRHPSRRRLDYWVETGGPEKVNEHVTGCDRCSTAVEELAEPAPPLRAALVEALAAPDDLVERLDTGIARRLRDRAASELLFNLLGLPVQTSRLLSGELDAGRE